MLDISADSLYSALTPARAIRTIMEAVTRVDPESVPERLSSSLPHGTLLYMPGSYGTYDALKVLTLTPDNPARGLPYIQGTCTLYDGTTHAELARVEGAALTALRTPAVSLAGVFHALRRRFPTGVRVALFGNGVQALPHLRAAAAVVPLDHVDVFVRTAGRAAEVLAGLARTPGRPQTAAEQTAAEPTVAAEKTTGLSCAEVLQNTPEAAEALRAADLVITVTSSGEPLFAAADVKDDAVVVAAGSHAPERRELPGELMGRATVIVESRAAVLSECGDALLAQREGLFDPADAVTFRDTVVAEGRNLPDTGPIVFKTAGMGWEDAALAAWTYEALHGSTESGVGTSGTTVTPGHVESRLGEGLRLAAATSADIGELVALVESAYRGDSSRAGWTTEADLLGGQRLDAEMAAAALADPDSVTLVVRDGDSGALAGTVLLKREDARTAYYGTFAVAPTRQGSGLGSALMAVAQDWAREHWAASRMRMTVINKRSDLIAYYERKRWARTGATEPFPYGQPRFGIPKVDDLEFVELALDL
ncbi:GNAT family N-acetyltransferase [Brevibacterium sp. 91QC2O2]|uniref:GNAT family N-acetyltransferase n=1 Tax=Brevibacterium sp. 91QC2O2 TaxID=2968458 RepID=UPI00211C0C84|nr:GNAT family N-acetyltransferase [Brevibacterium sp. 91QC2O2]MCQ9367520.1 GNAT family N-acetyltransferase [Brevibacterium sp. 91QC2O2]